MTIWPAIPSVLVASSPVVRWLIKLQPFVSRAHSNSTAQTERAGKRQLKTSARGN